jgi:hypothetical protein
LGSFYFYQPVLLSTFAAVTNEKKRNIMKTKMTIILAGLLLMISVNSKAQKTEEKHEASLKPFSVELNLGASMAVSNPGGSSFQPGFGFEGIFTWNFLPHTGVYGGWGWNKLSASDSFAGDDVCLEETGYIIGLQFKHPMEQSKLAWYIRAGALYNHLELENSEGLITADTGHGAGYQLAAGVDFSIGSDWHIVPGVKFNSLKRKMMLEGQTYNLKHNYLSLRVGIEKSF